MRARRRAGPAVRRPRRHAAVVAVFFLVAGCSRSADRAFELDLAKVEAVPSVDLEIVRQGDGTLTFIGGNRNPFVDFPLDLRAADYNLLEVHMTSHGASHRTPRVLFRTEGEGTRRFVEFRLPPRAPGSDEPFLVHLDGEPGWKGRVTGMRLHPTDIAGVTVDLESIRFRRLPLADIVGEDGDITHYRLGVETRDVVYVPVGTERRFSVELPGDGVLRYAVGLPEFAWERAPGEIWFRISHEGAGRREELQRVILDPDDPAHRGWQDRSVALPSDAGETIDLLLETKAPEGSPDVEIPAFFAHPRVAARTGPMPVLLISLDTLRADHLGLYGYPRATSPWLDRLARDSAVFLRAKSQATKTLPSHMTLFTGLLPSVHGVVDEGDMLPRGWPTWVDRLRERGYHTAAFTEDAFVSALFGFRYGFDRYHDGTFHIFGSEEKGGDVRATFERASRFFEENAGYPFFVFLHTYEPHSPYCAEPPLRGRFRESYEGVVPDCIADRYLKRISGLVDGGTFGDRDREAVIAAYDEEIRFTDAVLGQTLARLEELGLLDETLIVVVSDHGEDLGDHRRIGRHGHQVYDSVVHVPLLVRWPAGGVRAGIHHQPVGLTDVGPTILDLLGLGEADDRVQGRSLAPILRGRAASTGPVFSENRSVFLRVAVEQDGFKLIQNLGWNRQKFSPDEVPSSYREVFGPLPGDEDEFELYDLASDPAERVDLSASDDPVARRAKAALTESLQRMVLRSKEILEHAPPKAVAGFDRDIDAQLGALGYKEEVPEGGAPEGDEEEPDAGTEPGRSER